MFEYKFLYYLSAIGQTNLDIKLAILKNNLNHIYKHINTSFDIMLNCYDDDITEIQTFLNSFDFLNEKIIHKKKGRLVELWLSNPHHDLVSNYDYILYIMDDVLIHNIDINEFINIKNKYEISFLSPKIIGGDWEYMKKHDGNILGFSYRIEIFCLLLTPADFAKFMDISDIENTHTWGIDLLLGHFNIKSAIYYKFKATHILPSTTNRSIAGHEMIKYLNKHGFSNTAHVCSTFTDIYSAIEV